MKRDIGDNFVVFFIILLCLLSNSNMIGKVCLVNKLKCRSDDKNFAHVLNFNIMVNDFFSLVK